MSQLFQLTLPSRGVDKQVYQMSTALYTYASPAAADGLLLHSTGCQHWHALARHRVDVTVTQARNERDEIKSPPAEYAPLAAAEQHCPISRQCSLLPLPWDQERGHSLEARHTQHAGPGCAGPSASAVRPSMWALNNLVSSSAHYRSTRVVAGRQELAGPKGRSSVLRLDVYRRIKLAI
jgi:hypothetical protein